MPNFDTADAMDPMALVYEAYISGAKRAASRGLVELKKGNTAAAEQAFADVLTFLTKE